MNALFNNDASKASPFYRVAELARILVQQCIVPPDVSRYFNELRLCKGLHHVQCSCYIIG